MQEKSSLDFAGRLTHALKHSGVKASHLATKAGVSKGYVSELLKGNKSSPSIETCKKFSEVLNVPMVWLFDGETKPEDRRMREDAKLFPDASREDLEAAHRRLDEMALELKRLGNIEDMLARLLEKQAAQETS